MKSFQIKIPWMQQILTKGIPVPSSTIITGPAGAGKPLIGTLLADAWLKQGGSLIILMINFKRVYTEKLFLNLKTDLKQFADQTVYVELDLEIAGVEKSTANVLLANLLKPHNLMSAIRQAKELLPDSDLGTLVYGSALNMLLFSPTYAAQIHQTIVEILQSKDNYLFTIADNTFEELVSVWDGLADNLFFVHGTGIMQLGLKIIRMNNVSFNKNEVRIPISEKELRTIRAEAEMSRKHLIPMIRKI